MWNRLLPHRHFQMASMAITGRVGTTIRLSRLLFASHAPANHFHRPTYRAPFDLYPSVLRKTFSIQTNSNKAEDENDRSNDVNNDEDEEDEETLTLFNRKELAQLSFKNYDVNHLRAMEEEGRLVLRPFYQRGYKWTQKQASLWMESILRGFPCVPEVILLMTQDNEGDTQYATFDGQQRLTSILSFLKNERGDHWEATQKQKAKNQHASFALQGLSLKELEGCTFKDLSKREQNIIKNYDVRCAIIPSSWAMDDYIEFFKRIQGGGTSMSDHELRRAISPGPFTNLLDQLATNTYVERVFGGSPIAEDRVQDLLLRYFSLTKTGTEKFGKPTMTQQGLETMKRLNMEMESWEPVDMAKKEKDLLDPLLGALDLISQVFKENEPFRRVQPLICKDELKNPSNVFRDSTKVNKAIFDCTVYCFSRPIILKRRTDLLENRDSIRLALIDLMQTDPAFTESLTVSGISTRLAKMESRIHSCLENLETPQRETAGIPRQTRVDLIASARESKMECPLCQRPLGPFDEHLHIDHIVPKAKGGSNDIENL